MTGLVLLVLAVLNVNTRSGVVLSSAVCAVWLLGPICLSVCNVCLSVCLSVCACVRTHARIGVCTCTYICLCRPVATGGGKGGSAPPGQIWAPPRLPALTFYRYRYWGLSPPPGILSAPPLLTIPGTALCLCACGCACSLCVYCIGLHVCVHMYVCVYVCACMPACVSAYHLVRIHANVYSWIIVIEAKTAIGPSGRTYLGLCYLC